VTATARKIAVLFHNTLRFGKAYVDPGADYYEERYRQRVLANLRHRAGALGFTLVEGAVTVGSELLRKVSPSTCSPAPRAAVA
jgi:hypothetical protein